MNRPTFVVRIQAADDSETDYDAHALIANFNGTVVVISSGAPMVVDQHRILKVEYRVDGASWCGQCDQSIEQFSRG